MTVSFRTTSNGTTPNPSGHHLVDFCKKQLSSGHNLGDHLVDLPSVNSNFWDTIMGTKPAHITRALADMDTFSGADIHNITTQELIFEKVNRKFSAVTGGIKKHTADKQGRTFQNQ